MINFGFFYVQNKNHIFTVVQIKMYYILLQFNNHHFNDKIYT